MIVNEINTIILNTLWSAKNIAYSVGMGKSIFASIHEFLNEQVTSKSFDRSNTLGKKMKLTDEINTENTKIIFDRRFIAFIKCVRVFGRL